MLHSGDAAFLLTHFLSVSSLEHHNCREQASLTMSAVSSTFCAHFSEHSEKSAISLSLMVCLFQPRLACNQSSDRNSARPMHLFGLHCDHDYYFELLREAGAGRNQ